MIISTYSGSRSVRTGRRSAWPLLCLAAMTTLAIGQGPPRQELPPVNPDPFDPSVFPLQQWHPDIDAEPARPDHPPLDTVPAMPMMAPDKAFRNPFADGSVTLYDATTGRAEVIPLAAGAPQGAGISNHPWIGLGGIDVSMERARGMGTMSQVSDANLSVYPYSPNVRLLMRYLRNNGTNAYFVCSGSMTDQGIVLTAAHCVYNRDSDINDWAEEIWIYPAWDGSGNSPPSSTNIINAWGWARGTGYIAGSDYVNNGNWDRDCAAISIDRYADGGNRSVGELTGQFGWSYGHCDTGVTHYNMSYPSEDCSASLHTGNQMYFWSGTPDGCPGLFNGNQYDLDTSSGCLTAVWGGMSGSAMYRFIDGSRFAGAVCSTSNRSTDANYCALWEQFTTDLESFKDSRRGNTFDIEALMYRTGGSSTVVQGAQIPAGTVRIVNATNANPASATYTIRVYLSSNSDISSSDTLLATYNYTVDFGAQDGRTFNVPAITIPYGTPPGSYYAGVIIDPAEDTNDSNSDTDTWDAQPITVTCLSLSAPTGVSATDDTYCDRVRVSWNSVAGADQYFVYRNTSNSTSGASLIATDSASPYDDTTAVAGTTYYYFVRADSNCSTSAYSTSNSGRRQTAVGTPTGVSASDGTACGSVTVSWSTVSNADLYYVYRNTSNTTSGATLLSSDTASPYVDSSGVAGTTYYYFVRANNACGTGSYSSGNAGYGSLLPSNPTGVAATDGTSCASVTVSWNAISGADTYYIYRNTSNTTAGATLLSSDNASPYTDATAVAGTTYFYFVRAGNECGTGGYSASNSGYRNIAPTTAPGAVSASDGASCTPEITINWSATANTTGYRILRNTVNNAATAAQIGTAAGPPYLDVTAAANTTYYYWVGALNACGNGPLGIPDTGNRGSAPAAPATVAATDGTRCDSVVVTWTASAGATGYQIWRNTVNNSGTAVQIGVDSASPYVDGTVVGSTVYFYWVRATSSCGTSGFSTSNSGFGGTGVVFDSHPSDLSVFEGNQAQFTVDVGGATSYRWRKDGSDLADGPNITGSGTDTLTILSCSASDEGRYACFVTTRCGSALSDAARLRVEPLPCPADYNQDGGIDGSDVDAFFADWEGGLPGADVNQDGGIDGSDVDYFFLVWEAGGCF